MASVTVIGGGIFGLACGWELAQRGATVTVIKRGKIGAGSSGGHVGALAPHAPENWNGKKQFQLDSLIAAGDFFAAAEAAGGVPALFARTGRLQPLADLDAGAADRLAERIAASAARWPDGMAMRVTDHAPPGALMPVSASGRWLIDGFSARIAPRAALASLAAAIGARGGRIETGREVPADADLRGPVLWATGAAGLAALGHGPGVKGQSALLAYPLPDNAPQVFADGLHIVPHADGTTAIGSTSENTYDTVHPDHQAQDLLARAVAICPTLADAPVLDIWAGLRPRARSRAPVLAPWPGRPGHLIVNGGFKIGFGMAPLIADLTAQILLGDRRDIPDLFALP